MIRAALHRRALALAVALTFTRAASAQDAGSDDVADATVSAPDASAPDATSPRPRAVVEAASGASEAAIALARRRYQQGVVFFRTGHVEEAITEFAEAWTLWHNPRVLYALGQAHERLLRVPRAIQYYERYLALAQPDATEREAAEESLRELRGLLTEVDIECNVPARVFADGEEVGVAPGMVQLAIGRYELELRAEGYVPQRRRVSMAAGTRHAMVFRLVAEEVSTTGLHRGWFWASAALTAASAITAASLGVATLAASSAYRSDPARTVAARDEGNRLAVGTDVALAGTLLFGVAAVVLWFRTSWAPTPPRRAVLTIDPDGRVGVAGRF